MLVPDRATCRADLRQRPGDPHRDLVRLCNTFRQVDQIVRPLVHHRPAGPHRRDDRQRLIGHRRPGRQLDRLAGLIEETMEAVNYTTRGMRSANGDALRVLLHRLMPNEADLRRMMGLFRRILWQLRRHRSQN